jgi:hypothetical protein
VIGVATLPVTVTPTPVSSPRLRTAGIEGVGAFVTVVRGKCAEFVAPGLGAASRGDNRAMPASELHV